MAYNNGTGKEKSVASAPKKNSGGNMTKEELRKALMSSPKENENGIKRHIMNEDWVKQRDEALARNQLPKSGISIGERRIRSLVRNKLTTGDFEMIIARRGDARARMSFKEPIGTVFFKEPDGRVLGQRTRILEIVYSKDEGYHFFPVIMD